MGVLSDACSIQNWSSRLWCYAIIAVLEDSSADLPARVVVPVAYLLPPAHDDASPFEVAVLGLTVASRFVTGFLSLLSRVIS